MGISLSRLALLSWAADHRLRPTMSSHYARRLSLVSPLCPRLTRLASCIDRKLSRSFLAASKARPSIPDFAFAFEYAPYIQRKFSADSS